MAQKDTYAALVNMHASRVQLEIEKENSIGLSWAEMAAQGAKRLGLRLQAGVLSDALPLCLQTSVLQSRVRPTHRWTFIFRSGWSRNSSR